MLSYLLSQSNAESGKGWKFAGLEVGRGQQGGGK